MKFVERVRTMALWGRYFAVTGWHFIFVASLRRHLLRSPWPMVWKSVRAWGVHGTRTFGVEIRFRNPENVPLERQYIIVANHRSWFDQLALVAKYPQPFHCLVKKGYCDYPLFGHALTEFAEAVPVESKSLNPAIKNKLFDYLERGDTALFFVEGTRGSGKTLLPFRAGAFQYAAKMNIPILPIYIFGTEQILSKQKSLLTVKSGTAILIVDQPRRFTLEKLQEEMETFEQEYRQKHEAWYEAFTSES